MTTTRLLKAVESFRSDTTATGIMKVLKPTEINTLAQVDRKYRSQLNDRMNNAVWEKKFAQLHPYLYMMLKHKKNVYWKDQFKKASNMPYDIDGNRYAYDKIRLNEAVCFGDLEYIRENCTYQDLDKEHRVLTHPCAINPCNTVDYYPVHLAIRQRDQNMLDYFFKLALRHLMVEDYYDTADEIDLDSLDLAMLGSWYLEVEEESIIFWAIACHQPLPKILEFIDCWKEIARENMGYDAGEGDEFNMAVRGEMCCIAKVAARFSHTALLEHMLTVEFRDPDEISNFFKQMNEYPFSFGDNIDSYEFLFNKFKPILRSMPEWLGGLLTLALSRANIDLIEFLSSKWDELGLVKSGKLSAGISRHILYHAVLNGFTDAVEVLLKAGVGVTAANPILLIFAAASPIYNLKLFELLIEAGVNVNNVDTGDGQTALHVILDRTVGILDEINPFFDLAETAEIVKYLLANGADPFVTDKAGYTARDYAKRKNYTEIAAILEDAEARLTLASETPEIPETPEIAAPRKRRMSE